MTNLVDLLIVCATFPIQSAFCQSSALASSALSQLIDIHNTLAIMADANYPAIAQLNTSRSPGLLAAVPDSIRLKHCRLRTEETYVHWIRRFIHFYGKGLANGYGDVELPHALDVKYPRAGKQWHW